MPHCLRIDQFTGNHQTIKMDVRDKVAIVSGGAIGIGFEICKELLKHGAMGVIIADINKETGQEAIRLLSKNFESKRMKFIKTDVTNYVEFEETFKKTKSMYGKIDILVNNAAILNDKNYDMAINVNLNGVVRGIFIALKYLAKNQNGKGGLILNVASVASVDLQQYFPIYSATKAGVVNLTRGFGHPYHYNRTGVAVIAICPGKTDTDLQAEDNMLDGCQDDLAEKTKGEDLQKPDAVARAASYIMKNGKSGSVWMIDQNNLYNYNPPDWEKLREIVIKGI